MASKKIYLDLDGQKLNILKNWRTNPISTPDRIALGATLNALNIGLPAYDIDQQVLYMWNGSIWIVSGGAPIPATWGAITGNIQDQTDLQAEFALKVDVSSLATVAFSGNYDDLINLPVIPPGQIQSDYTQTNTAALDYIKNKPVFSVVAFTGQYSDLLGKPVIPSAQVNSDWNAVSGVAQILNKPTTLGAFTNDVGFITASSTNTLTNKSGNISQWTNNIGYITSASLPTPSAPTTSIQFNNGGVFGGSANLTWDGTTLTTIGKNIVSGGNAMVLTQGTTLSNPTPATSSVLRQYSPMLGLFGNAWNSISGASFTSGWLLYNSPSDPGAGGFATAILNFAYQQGISLPVTAMTLSSTSTTASVLNVSSNSIFNNAATFNGAISLANSISIQNVGTNVAGFVQGTTPVGIRIYNTFLAGTTPTMEYVELGYKITPNVFGITSKAAGTGIIHPIAITGANLLVGTTTDNGAQLQISGTIPVSIVNSSIGTTPLINSGIHIQNTTLATSIQNQSSPAISLEGQGWKTIATAASQPTQILLYNKPSTGTLQSFPSLQLDAITGGAANIALLNVSSIGAGTIISSGANILTIGNNVGVHVRCLTSNGTQFPQSSVMVGGTLNIGGLIDALGTRLHIEAGTTTISQINLSTSVTKTIPLAGDIWFDGSHYYGTIDSTPVQLDNVNDAKIVGGIASFTPDGTTGSFNIAHTLTTVTSHTVSRNLDPNGNLIETQIIGTDIVVTFVAGPPPSASAILFNWLAFGT